MDATRLMQKDFDPLGPRLRSIRVASGRTANYIDEGQPDWTPLVFLGGAGTTVRAFGLLEFARTLREELRVRVISVERNGLGGTAFDPAVGFAEYADDVWSVLDSLGIREASIIAISGGGPYAAWLAAAQPGRVRSLHLACAFSDTLAGTSPSFDISEIAANPVAWWTFPPDSSVHRIPGFADSAIEEALRGSFALGRDTPPDGLRQAFELSRNTPLPALAAVVAPSFLYWGTADPLVPAEHRLRWGSQLPNVVLERIYSGEGHDVQYRHWDQILADVAFLGGREIVSTGGETLLATPRRAVELRSAGAIDGMAAWAAG